MASNQATSLAPISESNKKNDFYPLWRHVKKIAQIPGGGSWEWECNLCHQLYKGSYPRVKEHLFRNWERVLIVAKKQVTQKGGEV
jgi:hypothetical protein